MLSAIRRSLSSLAVLIGDNADAQEGAADAVPAGGSSTVTALKIPVQAEPVQTFSARAAAALRDPDTRIYVDTSLLMWLTKIGAASRSEFFAWLEQNCAARVHVPSWAAHEYLRHRVRRTIPDELGKQLKQLRKIAARTYSDLRPFLDEPLGSATAEEQQVAARDTLGDLQRLVDTVDLWTKRYEAHTSDVLEFVNAHTYAPSTIFDHMLEIETVAASRFTGRIPPGHQDKRKKDVPLEGDSTVDTAEGSNRWGDLMFWNEILDHAAGVKPRCIVVLSNDQKNDWHLGGRDTKGHGRQLLAERKKWSPLPLAHPMLTLEAGQRTGAEEVLLLDSVYLALVLRSTGTTAGLESFLKVAFVPDPPPVKGKKQSAPGGARATVGPDLTGPTREQAEAPLKPSLFVKALRISADTARASEQARSLLAAVSDRVVEGGSVADILTSERIAECDVPTLVHIGRTLHDRAIAQEPQYAEALADIVGSLATLPLAAASALYLGILASMYFVGPENQVRIPPSSPVAKLVLERQGAAYATVPIQTVRQGLAGADRQPLYAPRGDRPPVEVRLSHRRSGDETLLTGIRLAGELVAGEVAEAQELRLTSLLSGRTQATGREIVELAARVFTVPMDQVTETAEFAQTYQWESTAGFRSPTSVFIEKEETS